MPDTNLNITPTPGMPPVTTTTSGATSASSTHGIVQTPAAAAAQRREQGELENIAQQQENVAGAIGNTLEQKAQAHDLIAADSLNSQDEITNLINAQQPYIDEARRKADEADNALANHKFYDWWGTKSTGDKIVIRLQRGLNAFGNGLLGIAGNETADRIRDDIKMDFARQEKELYSKEMMAKWRRQGVTDAYAQLQTELAHLGLKQAKAHEAVAAKSEAMLLRAGVPEEVAKQNVVAARAREEATKYRAEAEEKLRQTAEHSATKSTSTQTTDTGGKQQGGGVEADKNAANFAVLKMHGQRVAQQLPKLSQEDVQAVNRVMNAEDFLDGKPMATTLAGIFGKDAETGISDAAKAYLMDVRAAAEGLGRVQSGAAIGSVENKRFVRSFMPQQSDSPEVRQRRADNILADIDARGAYMARPARNQVAQPAQAQNSVTSGSAAQQPQIPQGAKRGTLRGKRGYLLNGKFTALE